MNIASVSLLIFLVYLFIYIIIDLVVFGFNEVIVTLFVLSMILSSLLFFLAIKLDKFDAGPFKLSGFVFLVCLLCYVSVIFYLAVKHGINFFTILDDFNFLYSESIRGSIYSESGFILLWLEYSPILIFAFLFQKNPLLGIASFLIMAYIFVAFGTRGHVVNQLISALIFLHYNNSLRIKLWLLPLVASLGVVAFLVLTFIKLGLSAEELDAAFKNLFHRLKLGYIQAFEVIDYANQTGFEFGKSYIRDLLTLLPGSDIGTNKYLSIQIYKDTSYGNLTPTIIGEGYLNFGILSSILLLLYGFLIVKVDKGLRWSRNYPEVYLITALFLVKLLVNGWSGVVSIFIFALMVLILSNVVFLSKHL